MPTKAALSGLSLAVLVAAGCGPREELATGQGQYHQTTTNAFTLNAFTLNAFTLNAFTLNAFTLNAFTLNGVDMSSVQKEGTLLTEVTLDRTRLVGKRAASYLSETDLSGVTMNVEVTNGQTTQLRIDAATWDSTIGIYKYTLSLATDQGWVSPCGTENGQPIPAIFLAGSWSMVTGAALSRQDKFTPACFGSALAKCVLWGYAPWAEVQECSDGKCVSQAVKDWHQACTRLVRADYCGDGVAHTRNGTPIDPWDNLGIQVRSPELWEVEADWGVDGAQCIRHTRWVSANNQVAGAETDLGYIQRVCPSRLAASNPAGCDPTTSNFLSSVGLHTPPHKRLLIRNSSPPPQ